MTWTRRRPWIRTPSLRPTTSRQAPEITHPKDCSLPYTIAQHGAHMTNCSRLVISGGVQLIVHMRNVSPSGRQWQFRGTTLPLRGAGCCRNLPCKLCRIYARWADREGVGIHPALPTLSAHTSGMPGSPYAHSVCPTGMLGGCVQGFGLIMVFDFGGGKLATPQK